VTTQTAEGSGIVSALFVRLQQLAGSGFFSRDVSNPGVWQTISWWEVRRIPYNLLVGAAGFVTCAVSLVTGLLCEHFLGDPIGIPNPPIFAFFAVVAYGIMANVCYTGGWAAELLVQRIWPEEGQAFGRISFFLGLTFSILLTLVPGVVIAAIGALSLLGHFVGK
jgi:hypothetical protein